MPEDPISPRLQRDDRLSPRIDPEPEPKSPRIPDELPDWEFDDSAAVAEVTRAYIQGENILQNFQGRPRLMKAAAAFTELLEGGELPEVEEARQKIVGSRTPAPPPEAPAPEQQDDPMRGEIARVSGGILGDRNRGRELAGLRKLSPAEWQEREARDCRRRVAEGLGLKLDSNGNPIRSKRGK